jgi:exopolysaccharide biosynthesis polyprenyl glycosylphosphotransferase
MSTLAALHEQIDDRTLEILEHRERVGHLQRRGWLVRRALFVADMVGLFAAFVIAEQVFGGGISRAGHLGSPGEYVLFVGFLPMWAVAAKLYGLYDKDEERTDHSTTDDFSGVFHLVTVATWVLFAVSRITPERPELQKLLVFWAAAVLSVPIARVAARAYARRQIAYLQNTVIVGAGDVGQLVARKLLQHPEYGINLVGFVDDEPKARREDLGHLALLGGPEELIDLVRLLDVERVIFAFSNQEHRETLELIRALRDLDVQIDLVPRLFEIIGRNLAIHTVEGLPVIGLPPAHIGRSSLFLKRCLDVAGALAGLAVTWPIFAYAAWRIRRDSPGPIFFRQRRLGMGMTEFTALKFRTMRVDTDDSEHRAYIRQIMSTSATPHHNGIYKLDRSAAITPFGQWLRKTSMDELPQLINVLRGQMSLVGPRPCIPYETETFEPHHFERFLVPQGLTGLWQVTARAHSTFGEALDLDVVYARSWSLKLDLALMFKTPIQVLRTRGTA